MNPHKSRRRWLFLLTCLLVAPVCGQSGDEQAELDRLRARIKQTTAQLNQDKAERNSVQGQLATVEQEMVRLSKSLNATESRIDASRGNIENHEADIRALKLALAASRAQLKRLVYAGYVTGRAEYFKLLLNQEDPSRLGRNLAYYHYLSRRRIDDILEVDQAVARLDRLKFALETENQELKALLAAQLSRQKDLNTARAERNTLLKQLEQRIGSRREELAQLEQNAARLQRLLTDLKNALSDLPTESALDQRFSAMQGKLSLPVNGTISARFGQSRGRTGVPWEGIFMTAQEGTVVRSIFPGRVAFADWLRGFGLLLILDHGDGYMSLYSHNQLLYKQVGEWANAGEPIAQVGSSGGLSDTGLYFEIRQDGEPRNPLIWCKVE